jgi:hypothetical protein
MNRLRRLAMLVALAVTAGCASLDGQFGSHLASPLRAVRECAQWYQAMDEQIGAAGVRDAQYARVAGFPYLRVDRFHSSLRVRVAASPGAMQAFTERLFELDIESRRHEIENLPRSRFEALPGMGGATRTAALRRTVECGRLFREIDLAKDGGNAIVASAVVPDDYSDADRLLGFYPLTRLFFFQGVKRWEEETRAAFQGEAQLAPGAILVRYAPPLSAPVPRAAVAGILGTAELDALGVPILSARELGRIAAAYAPSFEVVISGDFDRFGRLRWQRGSTIPEVDAAEAAVYVHPAYTRYGGRVLLQLVYTLWFPERPAQGAVDLLAGRLDGVMWRVTLAPDGEPLIYDSIHACGCYHEFFPAPRARARPAPEALQEWAFVPQELPAVGEDEHPMVRIASRTHYIERVSVVRGPRSIARYVLHPYDELRSLPTLEGGSRSAFGPDGIIAGSERAERRLFWPMGIASAGAMRQWGRHATAFVGRRHFDDPDLLEKRFELELAERVK